MVDRTTMRPARPILACAATLISIPAFAQTATTPTGVNTGPLHWTPVDQGLGDRGPLSQSLHDPRVDLRTGYGFEREYKLDRPRLFAGPDYYMRQSGGLIAIYQQPNYTSVGGGLARADIPAGTVYSIGGPVRQLIQTQPDSSTKPQRAPSTRVDRSAAKPTTESARQAPPTHAAPTPTPRPTAAPETEPPPAPAHSVTRDLPPDKPVPPSALRDALPPRSIWLDEDYRKQRIAALLDQAAKPGS
jgi:hypothetical protein